MASVGRSSRLLCARERLSSGDVERTIRNNLQSQPGSKEKATELSQSTKPFFVGLVESAPGQWKNSDYPGTFGKLSGGEIDHAHQKRVDVLES
jgi:hypothetical protein